MRTDWVAYFRELGYSRPTALSRGVEGATYDLGDDLVAKVWFTRKIGELAPLRAFYAELLTAGLPFATPDIVDGHVYEGRAITIERKLPGTPLSTLLDHDRLSLRATEECALDVLTALAATTAGPAALALPVMADAEPFWSPQQTWSSAWIALLQKRLATYGDQLRAAVDLFDAKAHGAYTKLAELPPAPQNLIHGDLCLPNILADGDRVTALLDWGFLTTGGDPAFDASTFAGFFDMYGPQARERDEELTAMIRDRFGYPAELLLLYRAAYALIGSNAYDPAGADGHFDWCVATLNRPDVSDVLLD